jgi:hypothetical protein
MFTKQRGSIQWELEEDKYVGLAKAANSNQPQLGMLYAEAVVRAQRTEIDQLKAELSELKVAVMDLVRASSEDSKRRGRPAAEKEPASSDSAV